MRKEFTSFGLPVMLWPILLIISCQGKFPKNVDNRSAVDTAEVKILIKRGQTFKNSYTDSLANVYKKLLTIGSSPNQHNALVYGELFETNYYWRSADHKKAMASAVKALADAEKYHVKEALPSLYMMMGNLHKEEKNYGMAFKSIDEAIKLARQNKDTATMISALGNKAMFIRGNAVINNDTTYKTKALAMQLEGLRMALSSPKFEQISIPFYTNIAQAYKDRGDLDSTLRYANEGIALANKYGQKRSLTYAYCWIGQAYYNSGQHVLGLEFLKKALATAVEIKEPYRQMEIYGSIYDCYYSSGDYKQAIVFSNRSRTMRDSLQVLMNVKQLNELQLKYETEKKDKQITLLASQSLSKSRQILRVVVVSILFILLSVVLLNQYFVIRKQNRLITEKNNVLNEAMSKIAFVQSHEVRRPLASIQGLINVIRAEDNVIDQECLNHLEKSAKDLDEKIRTVIVHTEVNNSKFK